MSKLIRNIIGIVSVLFLAWVFLSWADIIAHNLDTDPIYHSWNFFMLAF